jgi:hypothetical protein
MKTALISVDGDVPETLRTILDGGSTALVEYRADELSGAPQPDADRIVLWASGEDTTVPALAEAYVRGAAVDDRERIIVVLGESSGRAGFAELSPEQLFAWPPDEDRLKLVFLTGG